jgi:hypothetical protein
MKWLMGMLIVLSSFNVFAEVELTPEEIKLRTYLEVYRSYYGMGGKPRPRFNLSGVEVGWEVNDLSQGSVELECKGSHADRIQYRSVDLVDTIGNSEKPGCEDLEIGAIMKVCQFKMEEGSDEKAIAHAGSTCLTNKENPYNSSMPYPFVDDQPYEVSK